MKARAITSLFLALALAAGLFLVSGIAAAKGKKAGPVVVGKDDVGDWGCNQDCTFAPMGDALGMDLTGATIAPGEKGFVNFVISLNSLPPSGGFPEVPRYTWDLTVNGKLVELDGKFTNYSRGTCDPTAGCGSSYQPRDPGMSPFLIRGNCVAGTGNITTCQDLAIVQATFDAAAKTITIPVDMKLIGAKPGSKIAPGVNTFGGTISAAPATYFSESAYPMDTLTATGIYTVPK